MLFASLTALALLSGSSWSTAAEEPEVEIEWVADLFPGTVNDIAVAGEYAYLAVGSGMLILDISDPGAPARVAFLDLPGSINGIAVSDGYAYVTAGTGGLRIIDISNPAKPVEAGSNETLGPAESIEVVGNYAYVTDENRGLLIVNVSDPAEIRVAGHAPGTPKDVVIAGDYAYLADQYDGLQVVNISSKTQPRQAGRYDTRGIALDVAVAGDFAYVADGRLRVINISDPDNLTEVSNIRPGTMEWSRYDEVALTENHAYVIEGEYGSLVVINISNPANLREVVRSDDCNCNAALVLNGNFTYMIGKAGGESGLVIFDISEPAEPRKAGWYGITGSARAIEISGNFAYIISKYYLQIIDITEPAVPREIGSFRASHYYTYLAVEGDFVYVSDYNRLVIIDVSDPDNPVEAGNFSTIPMWAGSIAVSGHYAYLTDTKFGSAMKGNGGLRVIDVSNPGQPQEVGNYSVPGYLKDVEIDRNFAYVTETVHVSEGSGKYAWDGGLRVIDISDPTNPTEVGRYRTVSKSVSLAVEGDYAYVAGTKVGVTGGFQGCECLMIFDISDPAEPRLISSYETPPYPSISAVVGDYVYITNGREGVRIIDVSNPAEPREVGNYQTSGSARNLAVEGNYVYVAGGSLPVLYADTPQNISPESTTPESTSTFSLSFLLTLATVTFIATFARRR